MIRSNTWLRVATIAVATFSFSILSTAQAPGNEDPVRVVGEFKYQSTLVAKYFSGGSTAELMCVSRSVRGISNEFVPASEQILGRFTTPVYPPPLKFEIQLPLEPRCANVDVDNNGRPDLGVKVFVAMTAINLFGDSYLEQLEQDAGWVSILSDPVSETVRSGTLLIYSPDRNQRISSGFGPDKKLFTEDDPTVPVAAGYTLMKIADGKVQFERGTELHMDIAQPEESKNPDFSKQGLLESFNSLIDLLKERYAYTDVRKIDWEQKRAEYLPRIREADAKNDLQDFYLAIYDFAANMNDGHVQTGTYDPKIAGKRQQLFAKLLSGNLGAQMIRYTDGRFVVYSVGTDSAAEKAGITVGTEILRINGYDVLSYLKSRPRIGFVGTEERAIASALRFAFNFPAGESVKLDFRKPGNSEVTSATLVAGDFQTGVPFPSLSDTNPISLNVVGERRYGYVRWHDFENVQMNIAGFETFLMRSGDSPGIIIDLRENGGGLLALMYTMASYMFPADNPVALDWLDSYNYDDVSRKWVTAPKGVVRVVSAPRPEIAYKGKVVVLVDGDSASSAEFFSQFLQRKGRAVVIADSGTDGAGGSVRSVTMPGGFPFTYTGGRMYFAGTKEVNLEGKGVTADIRVPINDDYVRRRLGGEDVVLNAAIKYLDENIPKEP